ncbi:unnamed protein product [Caenorhabditis nigoni]
MTNSITLFSNVFERKSPLKVSWLKEQISVIAFFVAMKFTVFTISLLFLLAVHVQARDSDIDDEAYETEKVSYCPRREKWYKCGNGCERSCTNPTLSPKCGRPCIPHMCRCKKGYIRDNQGSGRCVQPHECKKWGK